MISAKRHIGRAASTSMDECCLTKQTARQTIKIYTANAVYSDPKDTVTAGWGLCLSALDLAKIGELVLNKGKYGDKQIVSGRFSTEMTAPHMKLGEQFGNMSYGYLWYKPYEDRQIFAAIGDGGNVIYVNREQNVSVGVTGTIKPRIFDRVDFIEKKVLPLVDD